ncbi:hypothetical protein [Pseudoalteromonas ardens]|nr:hypothetical protein [Pseudoalteromonas sp. R96]MDK1313647.1 hypothetical protein [Pseudoalteromonas sp. R96]
MPAQTKITEDVQFKIERLIRLWEGKLTWELLTQKIYMDMGIKVSRQTLEGYNSIYIAYRNQKELLRGVSQKTPKSVSLKEVNLIKRVEVLEAELQIKEKIINEQKRFLQRILQNATEIPALKGNLDALISARPEDKL